MMMNKMREIYGVVNMILFPEDEDPEMLSLELFSSFAKAKERSEEIIKEFIDDPVTSPFPMTATGFFFVACSI